MNYRDKTKAMNRFKSALLPSVGMIIMIEPIKGNSTNFTYY